MSKWLFFGFLAFLIEYFFIYFITINNTITNKDAPQVSKQEDPPLIAIELTPLPEKLVGGTSTKGSLNLLKKKTSHPSPSLPQEDSDPQNTVEKSTDQKPALLNRGAIAIYAPKPQIPAYLKHQSFHLSILIEFFIDSTGASTPTLRDSSGNLELDAIALKTVKTWKFEPAYAEGKPIASKTRLRIIFKVEP